MPDQKKHEIIYGRNSVFEALLAGKRSITNLFLIEAVTDQRLEKIKDLANKEKISIVYRKRKELSSLCGTEQHQGVVAFVTPSQVLTLEDILSRASKNSESPFLVILDRIEDPRNLGAIIRTAEAAGVHGIIISKHESCGLTPTVAKTSSGAMEYLPIIMVNNLTSVCLKLKECGLWLFGADALGQTRWNSFDLTMPLALVLGSEGKGLKRIIKEKCDYLMAIPMKGHVSSLNVSVAGAILMYEVVKQRNL